MLQAVQVFHPDVMQLLRRQGNFTHTYSILSVPARGRASRRDSARCAAGHADTKSRFTCTKRIDTGDHMQNQHFKHLTRERCKPQGQRVPEGKPS